jgi:MerR family transcriptional regulator, light-induced transcriptional regulator
MLDDAARARPARTRQPRRQTKERRRAVGRPPTTDAAPSKRRAIGPLLTEIGEAWADGRIGIAHEHAASAMVRRVLAWLLEGLEVSPGAGVMVVATPAGERHELGAMLAMAVAAQDGWRVTSADDRRLVEAIPYFSHLLGSPSISSGLTLPTSERL